MKTFHYLWVLIKKVPYSEIKTVPYIWVRVGYIEIKTVPYLWVRVRLKQSLIFGLE